MALNNNFYDEVFLKEEQWKDQIKKGLMNSIYCNYELKPFYLEKRHLLQMECDSMAPKMLNQILETFQNIIKKIEEFNAEYKSGRTSDMSELLPLFLVSQMRNESKEDINKSPKEEKITNYRNIKENLMKNMSNNYNVDGDEIADYVLDDFPQEDVKVK